MTIVILDGYTANPGDLSWEVFEALGRCEIFDRTPPEETLARAAKAEIVITNKVVLSAEHLAHLPLLRYIGILATGTNVVDLPAAQARGIVVTNVPAYGTHSVAQTTLALLLELTQCVGHHSDTARTGKWSACADWCYWVAPLIELHGLTLGIVGFGRIGQAFAALGVALGMEILAYHPRPKAGNFSVPVQFVGLETLFRQSDVVSLHCPLTPENRHLVNAERLAWMKPTALLLNTSRGLLVDEAALAAALNTGRLAGAGLDVLSTEPPPLTNPLLSAKNCVITPHLAWATRASRQRLMKIAAENVRAFLAGQPQNVVS
jgi:glycerate dehydrogenase